jgi:putative MATE family efflux protein
MARPRVTTVESRARAQDAGAARVSWLDRPVFWPVVRQGGFLALAMGSHAAVNLVDLWLVGKLGSHAVAGVHVATTVNFLPMIVGNGITVASMSLMARALGAGRTDEARRLSERAFTFMLLLGVVLGLALAACTVPCIDLQGADGEARAIGIHYLLVANLGTVTMFALMQATASMRAAGEAVMPLLLLLATNILNLLLDVVLLFGWDALDIPAAGAPGAAYASVIARACGAGVAVWWLRRRTHPVCTTHLRLRGPPGELRQMLFLGAPQSLQMVVRAGVVIALTSLAASIAGEVALTTLGVTTRLDTVVLFSAAGFASAATTLVGFAVGAGRPDRARAVAATASWCTFALGSLCALALWAWAAPLFALLVADAPPAVLAMATSYLGVAVVGHAFGCYAIAAAGSVNGAGKTLPPLLLDAGVYLLILPPALLIAARREPDPALSPLWWSLTCVNIALALAHWAYLRFCRWV